MAQYAMGKRKANCEEDHNIVGETSAIETSHPEAAVREISVDTTVEAVGQVVLHE